MTISKLNKNQIIELKALASYGENGTLWPTKDAQKFAKLGGVELGNVVDGDQTQIRISAEGVQYLKDMESPEENANNGVDTGSNNEQNVNQPGAVADQTKINAVGVSGMTIKIEDNVAIPTATRRTRTSSFPFDLLEVGQSFFVPTTEDRKDPAKSLASTVNGANERHSRVIPGEFVKNRKQNEVPKREPLRKFIVRAVDETEQGRGPGARVWRVALDAE